MKRPPPSVARRYARALLEVALEKGSAEALERNLGAASDLVLRLPELRRALSHPALSSEKKKKLAAEVWPAADPLFGRLLQLLIERGRVLLLPAVHEAYVALRNEQRGIAAATAVSAVPLAPAQESALAAAAAKLAGRRVTLKSSVDPLLLGGIVLRLNGRTYDGSVRTKLNRLRARLAEVGSH